MNWALNAIHYHGIHTESLGHYLTGLGLLSAASARWPTIRGCWRQGHFVLLGENLLDEQVRKYLLTTWEPTRYERWWYAGQKKDTKANKNKPQHARTSANLWKARNELSRFEVRVIDAHVIGLGAEGNVFNAIWGTGGNVGKRDLAKMRNDADNLRKRAEESDRAVWLEATLMGEANVAFPDLRNAGTWFVFANKTFNSGQNWFREGRLSPWSVLLAMEGALLLAGGAAKRLGVRARPYAVFPFMSEPSQPTNREQVGHVKAEFWAPLWENPATLIEVRSLFQRGLARLGGRPAQAPHEFAAAARAAGVDAGISEFVRYELRQTTSSKVYEAIPRSRIVVGESGAGAEGSASAPTDSELLMQLIDSRWINRLPYEPRDPKQSGKFIGLRGPVEAAIIAVSENPDDPERWQSLLLTVAQTQTRIDRNKRFRDRDPRLPLLHRAWFERAWPGQPSAAIEMARSIASIGAGSDRPLLVNVFGVEFLPQRRRIVFPKARPQRAVWNTGDPLQVFLQVAHRRLVDMEPTEEIPLAGTRPCSIGLVDRLIAGDPSIDLEMVARWIPALSLIDWSSQPRADDHSTRRTDYPTDGAALLHSLFRPLFFSGTLRIRGKALFTPELQPQPGLARRIFHLIRYAQVDEAIQVAQDRYLAARCSIVVPPRVIRVSGERLAAAMLIPIRGRDVARGLVRWLQPTKNPR